MFFKIQAALKETLGRLSLQPKSPGGSHVSANKTLNFMASHGSFKSSNEFKFHLPGTKCEMFYAVFLF